jgi:hypothetical protein
VKLKLRAAAVTAVAALPSHATPANLFTELFTIRAALCRIWGSGKNLDP